MFITIGCSDIMLIMIGYQYQWLIQSINHILDIQSHCYSCHVDIETHQIVMNGYQLNIMKTIINLSLLTIIGIHYVSILIDYQII